MLTNECHHCGNYIEFPDHGAGEEIPCPHCGRPVLLTTAAKTRPATELSATPAAETMPPAPSAPDINAETANLIATLKHLKTGPAGDPTIARKRSRRPGAIPAVVVLCLVGGLLVFFVATRKPSAPSAPEQTAVDRMSQDAAAEGAPTGLFGAKWLMSMNQVKQILTNSQPAGPGVLAVSRPFYDRPAAVTYHFTNDTLLLITVRFSSTSFRPEFEQVQTRLSAQYGPMPRPVPAEGYALSSTKRFKFFVIQHCLSEAAGLATEQIFFHVRGGGSPKAMPKAQLPAAPPGQPGR